MIQNKNSLIEQYFVFPADDFTNESFARYANDSQIDIYSQVECYIGDKRLTLPGFYPVKKMILKTFEKSVSLSFYVFIQKTRNGRKQLCGSHRVNKKEMNEVASIVKKMLDDKVPQTGI